MKSQVKMDIFVQQSKSNQIFCLSDNGSFLYYISYGKVINSLKQLNISFDQIEVNIKCPDFMVIVDNSKICVSCDDRYCCVSFERRNICNQFQLAIFDLKQKIILDILELQCQKQLKDLNFMPHSNILLVLCGGMTFIDFEKKQQKFIPEAFEQEIKSINLFQNNKKIILFDSFLKMRLINLENYRILKNFSLRGRINFFQVKVISDGSIFLALNHKIQMFSTQFRKLLRKIFIYKFTSFFYYSEKQIWFLTQDSICILKIDSCKSTIYQIDMPIDFQKAVLARKSNFLAFAGFNDIYIIQHTIDQQN